MATRAIPVIVERSPGKGNGYDMRVGSAHKFSIPCSEWLALDWIAKSLEAQGAARAERGRVLRLVIRELDRKRKAIVTAEVTS